MHTRRRARIVTRARLAGLVLGFLCLLGAGAARTAPKEERWLDVFPAYPGARRLCSQHVSGNTAHINWTLYATTDDPERVRTFYEKNPGGAEVEKVDGRVVGLRGPGKERLSIHGVEESYPSCGTAPTAKDRTAIVVSTST